MFYTTDQLLESIKLRSLVPTGQPTFTDANLVSLLNEELQLYLVPEIMSVRQDFFLDSKRTSIVANQSRYTVPERAIGNALKEVYHIDGNGSRRKLVHTDLGVLNDTISTTGEPVYFYIMGDEVVLYPTPTVASGSVEFWYYKRPNQLVLVENAVQIASAAAAAGQTTFTFTANTTFTTQLTAGTTKLDFQSRVSPFLLWNEDVVCDATTSTTVEVTTTDVQGEAGTTEPQTNDYICLAQQAVIPQVPQELHPILAQMVSARLMEALGHTDKLTAVQAKLEMMKKHAYKLISNRIEMQPDKILNRNNILAATGYEWIGPAFR